MPLLFWDASALAKRYFGEAGSDTVNALFTAVAAGEMLTTPWGYTETYAMLLRKRNSGVLDIPTFTTAVTALQAEVVGNPDLGLLSVDDDAVFASISMIYRHNLNATDAAILTAVLDYAQTSFPSASHCVVVAADRRLLRAADAEGLSTIDPETLPAVDVPAFLQTI
jgi:hypothetical protein